MFFLFIILKLIIFWGILFLFGFQLSKWLFKKSRIEILIALSGLIGTGIYIFLINVTGYFVPIKTTFYLILLFFAIIGLVLFLKNRSERLSWGIDKKWRKILLIITLLLITITFIVDNRCPLGGDQILLTCMPSAATIAEGDFPPQAIWVPSYPLGYHYGASLFAAAIHKTTGVPLYVGYDVQVAISVGILFLLGFILIKKFIKDDRKALISSMLMLYAGGLVFFRGLKGIPILYEKYILGRELFAPFKFVFEMVEALFSEPTIERMIHVPTNAISFVLMIGIIYVYFYSVKQNNKKIIILNALFLATLALFAEVFFAVFCFLLLVYPLVFGLFKKDWSKAKSFFINSLLIIIIAMPIAAIQGGILTHYLGHYLDRDGYDVGLLEMLGSPETELFKKGFELFKINKTPWLLVSRLSKDHRLPIYDFKFLLQWGLLLSLTMISIVYFWKRKSRTLLFLALSFFAFFSIPFLITLPEAISGNMERFFYPANLFGGLIAGVFLADLYFSKRISKRGYIRRGIILVFVLLIAQGIIFQLIFLTTGYPPGKWSNAGNFFATRSSFDAPAYNWIKENTTIDDYFLALEPDDFGRAPNLRFILSTGRMAPIYTYHVHDEPIDIPQSHAFRELIKNCDSELMKFLNYSYLYIDKNWPRGFEEKCLKNNNLELKFEAEEGERFIRIFKVL